MPLTPFNFLDKDLNYELHFGSSNSGYVLFPGPVDPIDQLSVCLWLKTSITGTFVYYHVEGEAGTAFQFGISSSSNLFGKMNGNLVERYLHHYRACFIQMECSKTSCIKTQLKLTVYLVYGNVPLVCKGNV